MKTTVKIDGDLLGGLEEQARREGTSVAELVNRMLRREMAVAKQVEEPARPYREKTFRMGEPKVDLP